MSSDLARIGSVAGVVLCSRGAPVERLDEARQLLERFFVEVRVVGSTGDAATPLSRLIEGLEGVEAERVLVVDVSEPALEPTVLLALTAWPEDDLVRVGGERGACSLVRREPVLGAARRLLSAGREELAALDGEVSASELPDAERVALEA